MAQSQSTTNEGYGELGKLLAKEAATGVNSVVCYEGTCSAAAETSTYSTPAATMITTAALILADATVISMQTTTANDTMQLDHTFTATATKTVTGFGVCNDDNDVLYAECCFNAGIAMESSDTLAVQMKIQFKAD